MLYFACTCSIFFQPKIAVCRKYKISYRDKYFSLVYLFCFFNSCNYFIAVQYLCIFRSLYLIYCHNMIVILATEHSVWDFVFSTDCYFGLLSHGNLFYIWIVSTMQNMCSLFYHLLRFQQRYIILSGRIQRGPQIYFFLFNTFETL
jgi:hypothetical protein